MATQICTVFPNLKAALDELEKQFALVGVPQIIEALEDSFVNTSDLFIINFDEGEEIKSLEVDYSKFLELSKEIM